MTPTEKAKLEKDKEAATPTPKDREQSADCSSKSARDCAEMVRKGMQR